MSEQPGPVLTDTSAISAAAAQQVLPAIPGYLILEELGRGGMGVVYKAIQLGLKRAVALKMILAGAHAGPEELARFRREAESLACLQHPNIVQIYDVGEYDGRPYFSLEFVAGGTLADRLRGEAWPGVEAAKFVETLARGVHAAHQAGIIHRDLKPKNVLLPGGGPNPADSTMSGGCQVKITDFGLAKQVDAESAGTATGAILGTPAYMAPEQAVGDVHSVGQPTDVYALGAILYEMLTGRVPFRGKTTLETLEAVRTQDPLPPSRIKREVPKDLETICLKCLSKGPPQRYPSAKELADELQRFLAGEPIEARPPNRFRQLLHRAKRRRERIAWGLVTISVVLCGALLLFLTPKDAESEKRNVSNEQNVSKLEGVKEKNHVLVGPAVNPQETRPRLFVMSVGISDYNKSVPPPGTASGKLRSFTSAKEAVADAKRFQEIWLSKEGRLMQVAAAELVANAAATPKAIFDGLHTLGRRAKPDDLIVLYFAGNGYVEGIVDDPAHIKEGRFIFPGPQFDYSRVEDTGITTAQLLITLAGIPCRKLLLVISYN
jgi:serine/threonine protein kinase